MHKKMLRLFLLFSCISGMLYCVESRFQFLRLRGAFNESLALISDRFFWERIDPLSHRFWPIFYLKARSFERSIMAIAPVEVKIKMKGKGFVSIACAPLEPWYMVFWSGGEWFLSREGRMWSVHHELNRIISEQSAVEGPVIVWGPDLPDPVPSGVIVERTVADSAIPVNELEIWKETLKECNYYSRISSLTIQRREGKRIVEILERRREVTVRILLNESPADWPNLLRAADDIFLLSGLSGNNITIDATYTGKILVRVIP